MQLHFNRKKRFSNFNPQISTKQQKTTKNKNIKQIQIQI